MKFSLVKVFRFEFQQNLYANLWCTWNISLMALYKPDSFMDQYSWKSGLFIAFDERVLYRISTDICWTVYGFYGNVHLSYLKKALF
jgi:hypothetical protein